MPNMETKDDSENLTKEDKKYIRKCFRDIWNLDFDSDKESSEEDIDIANFEQTGTIGCEQLSPRTKKNIACEVVYSFFRPKHEDSSLLSDLQKPLINVNNIQDSFQEPNEHCSEPLPSSVEVFNKPEGSAEKKYSESIVAVDLIVEHLSLCREQKIKSVLDETEIKSPVSERKYPECNVFVGSITNESSSPRGDQNLKKAYHEIKMKLPERKNLTCDIVESLFISETFAKNNSENNLEENGQDENKIKMGLPAKKKKESVAERIYRLSSQSNDANSKRRRSNKNLSKLVVETSCNSNLTDHSKINLRNRLDPDTASFQYSMKTETVTSHSQKTKIRKNKYKSNNSFYNTTCYKPMLDRNGQFFISKDIVKMYQDGLRNQWNPTQCVYEICAHCKWEGPKYVQTSYTLNKFYLFDVLINRRFFHNRMSAKNKKTAKHYASTKFLQFLGFRFCYEDPETIQPIPLNSKCTMFKPKQTDCCTLYADWMSKSVLKKRKVTCNHKTCCCKNCCF